jgi:hypothetical protein
MIQHRRVTGEGEIRLGLQRMTREFTSNPAAESPARETARVGVIGGNASDMDDVVQTNLIQSQPGPTVSRGGGIFSASSAATGAARSVSA